MPEAATMTIQTPVIEGAPRSAPADVQLAARLDAAPAPMTGTTAAARADALARLKAQGLPGPRHEYWRYTDPALFNAALPEPLPAEAIGGEPTLFADVDKLRLVFTDGRFDAAASDDLKLSGIEIATLAQADAQPGHWVGEAYGKLEAQGQKPVARAFAALNTAVATDGVVIRVTGQAARPVQVLYRVSDPAADVIVHHILRVEEGADLTLLENGLVGARGNVVIEADLAPGAKLHHISAHRAGIARVFNSHLFSRVAEGASLKSFELSVDGRHMRSESVIELAGDDAVAHVAAAVLGDGDNLRHDDTVFITHGGLRGESRQVFKKVLKNGATGVFQGKILVKPGAQKTDGYQISQALLLDETSQFLAKPELEIYADDVKCSHGSTTGALDETALFYLRSRGIPQERAVVLLVLSFLADALEEVENDELRAEISGRLEDWLTAKAR
ncbi:SufD family Fe-S cluster assembly protein [Paracoccus sp. MC1862]|nr:SufD family Fe-S cluster assembly protein [Paracoccus sp. MC1862]MBB1490342.1 SufD family Fe-S cluster assembly protein [Paracoccus sp. MC1854]MBB1497184.1 SufD family Fe-S cluster assembly protein [Paracoccus sp. MC1862]QQO44839.1 SufD family Fe-S cluster assembly protein [Paracoccus sp. MC1862]